MGFQVTRKFDLSPYGWKGCSITVRAISYKEMQDWHDQKLDRTDPKAAKKVFDYLENRFISGEGLDESGKKVQISKEDLRDLPFDIILGLSDWLFNGSIDPNLA